MRNFLIRLFVLVASISVTYVSLALVIALFSFTNPIVVMSYEAFIPFQVFGALISIGIGCYHTGEMADKGNI
jgi:hypothetical protein